MGIDQNIVSSMSINDTSGESGILTIILDIGIDLRDELQGLVNIDSNPLTNSTSRSGPKAHRWWEKKSARK